MQEADRDAFDGFGAEGGDEGGDGPFVERQEDVAVVVEPFGDGQPEVAGHEGLREGDVEVVLVVAALIAEGEDVAEAFGGDQRGAGALAFDDGVGGEGGAVDEEGDVGRGEAGGAEDFGGAVEDGALGVGRRGEDFEAVPGGADFEREVGEGAADVDGQPGRDGGAGVVFHGRRVPPLSPCGNPGHGAAGATRRRPE